RAEVEPGRLNKRKCLRRAGSRICCCRGIVAAGSLECGTDAEEVERRCNRGAAAGLIEYRIVEDKGVDRVSESGFRFRYCGNGTNERERSRDSPRGVEFHVSLRRIAATLIRLREHFTAVNYCANRFLDNR